MTVKANAAGATGQAGRIEPGDPAGPDVRRRLARRVLTAFLATFTFLRIMIFQIMDRRLPDMFVYVKGTHVHHLNFGIFLLAALGGWLLFGRPRGRRLDWATVLYGIGLALTFDEFGMWLHLGGGYWQRASFDAITVVAGFLALLAFGPSVKELRGRHAVTIAILLGLGTAFFVLLLRTVNKYGNEIGPRPAIRGTAQSQSEAAAGTAARSTRAIAPLTQTARQMPQP
jgi:hypothetical protein